MTTQKKSPHMSTSRLVSLALFTALALIIHTVEASLVNLIPIPGVKPGLANVITLIVLMLYGAGDAFLVLMLRIVLSAVFAGQIIFLAYSLAGGVLCFGVMALLCRAFRKKHIVLTSMFGAVFHNLGQILVALLLTGSTAVLIYVPFLMLSALVTGAFTGMAAQFTVRKLTKISSNP
ncbi:MAG: Gx transporter family protein [Lachnospiraceae bacterium]|nr:Gx transporter family protein [Lachnospiraceae bacterium]